MSSLSKPRLENTILTQLIHLTLEKLSRKIKLSGIRPTARWQKKIIGFEKVVFALPVVPNFQVSHQWVRELKRNGARTIVGVYFRIPDDEEVLVGHYAKNHARMTVGEAEGLIRSVENPMGYEVLIPRKIQVAEVRRIKPVPQLVGWRYRPSSHGQKPCGCPVCLRRGEFKSSKIRQRWKQEDELVEAEFARMLSEPAPANDFSREQRKQKVRDWQLNKT